MRCRICLRDQPSFLVNQLRYLPQPQPSDRSLPAREAFVLDFVFAIRHVLYLSEPSCLSMHGFQLAKLLIDCSLIVISSSFRFVLECFVIELVKEP